MKYNRLGHRFCFFSYSKLFLCLSIGIILMGCSSAAENIDEQEATTEEGAFKKYCYQGKAEITRYKLEQARYGEVHEGDAVLIFVTEGFLKDKQVKLENGNPSDATSVLKLNFTRKFNSGIYPYSLMTTTFTPVDISQEQHSLKVTTSAQEWCGHTFTQLNLRGGEFEGFVHSYFQDEADQEFTLKPALLEDEIWAKIRISPHTLPVGEIDIIPGTQFARLSHIPSKVEKADATIGTITDGQLSKKQLQEYIIDYKGLDRTLVIKFEKSFPHTIVAWEENYISGFGGKAKRLTTRAIKTHSILSDYWNKNSVTDSSYRKELGLF